MATPRSPRAHRTVDEVLAALEGHGGADTIAQNPRATIRPGTDPAARDVAAARASQLLEQLRRGALAEPLEFDRTLGEGGMGVVRLATQTTLGRKVAVKALKAEVTDPAATERLLREAWITGAIEHPNVVPVHTVALDERGRPQIVLKRIEGVQWGALMHDERTLRERFGARDALEWNLRTLTQVCDAVHFAHARGIVHRDLKPENVMIGEFGEVYVLDWGVAVALSDDGTGRFPLAADAREVAGTPAYMAPEMLGGDPPRISERTDVYLLGATLHEILVGSAPHEGGSVAEMVARVMLSRPEIPNSVPPELARIVRRAMDADPDARFENPRQLRLALQGYLQHRDSYQLADEAEVRLRELLDELARTESDTASAERRQRLYQLFGACRFGFRQALRIWGQNPVARDGIARATEAMVDYELRAGAPEAAASLLAELPSASPELSARVDIGRREHERERARIEDLARRARDLDPSVGRRTRVVVITLLGAMWTVMPLVAVRLSRDMPGGSAAYGRMAVWTGGLLVAASAVAVWARDSMGKSVLNRMVIATGLFALAAQLALQAGCALLGVDPREAVVLQIFNYFSIATMLALGVERRLLPIAGGYLAGFFLAAYRPEWAYFTMSGANLIMTLSLIFAWTHGPADRAEPGVGRRE